MHLLGLSFNFNFQSGLKLHGEVVLPDNDPFKPALYQRLIEGFHVCGLQFDEILQLVDAGNAIEKLNTGKYVPSMGLDHDSSLMPIGKAYKAELVSLKGGEYGAYIYQETFENFNVFDSKAFGTLYEASISTDSRPFADTEPESIEKLTVQLDPVNFGYEAFDPIKEQIKKDLDVEIDTFMRKSLIPDPEVVIDFIKDSFILLAATQTVNKTVEKLSSDSSNLYDKIKQIIIKVVKYIKPSNRPITYVMKENRGYILELLVRTADPNVLFQALSSEKLSFINVPPYPI